MSMRGEILRAVVTPAVEVLTRMTDIRPNVGHVAASDEPPPGGLLMVNVMITGEAKGYLLIGVEREGARKIASRMMGQELTNSADPMVINAMMELANIIAGNAVGPIVEKGIEVSIEPPTIATERPTFPPGNTVFVTLEGQELGHIYLYLAFKSSLLN